jgi:hypothetical protein
MVIFCFDNLDFYVLLHLQRSKLTFAWTEWRNHCFPSMAIKTIFETFYLFSGSLSFMSVSPPIKIKNWPSLWLDQQSVLQSNQGPILWLKKYILAKKWRKIWRFWRKTRLNSAKSENILKEKRQFISQKNGENRRKLWS